MNSIDFLDELNSMPPIHISNDIVESMANNIIEKTQIDKDAIVIIVRHLDPRG